MKKKTIGITLAVVLVIALSSFSSAHKLLCLTYGQQIPSPQNPIYSCWHDQCINICVTDNNFPSNPSFCKDMSACEPYGETNWDLTPPNMTLKSPNNGANYSSRKILFDIKTDEPSSYYYIDNINGRGRWKRICSNCQSYYRSISLKEGFNNITIKAIDKNDNSVTEERVFRIDSKKPKIKKTYPKKGFAYGLFEVEIQEANPKLLLLYYGNDTAEFNISECVPIKGRSGKLKCSKEVSLTKYDGQEIKYYFQLTDIADSEKQSKPVSIKIDETAPKILNPLSFYTQGEGRYQKYIYFNISIEEQNFDEVGYRYIDSRGREKYKRLCSRLKNDMCVKRKSFRDGVYNLTIEVYDKAENAIGMPLSFEVV